MRGYADTDILLEPERLQLTRVSRATWWRMEQEGLTPLRVQLSKRRVGWRYTELVKWLAERSVHIGEEVQQTPQTLPPSVRIVSLKLARFVVEHALREELSTHVAISFDPDDAAVILMMAESMLRKSAQ